MKPAPVERADRAEEEDLADAPDGDVPMTIWEHLEELRKRLVRVLIALLVGCIISWEFKEKILAALVKPFRDAWMAQGIAEQTTLHFASPGAAFVAYFKLSLIGGAALAAPVVFYQLWSFIAPGLYAKEKRYVIPFVLLSTTLFVGGGYFGWLAAFPITFDYFLSMSGAVEDIVTITPTVMMDEYITFVMRMLLGFGIVFEIPLVLTFLAIAGVVDHKQLIKFGRYFVFIAFVVAAIITPPDVTSQVVMAVPMIILYVVSIGLVFIFGKRAKAARGE